MHMIFLPLLHPKAQVYSIIGWRFYKWCHHHLWILLNTIWQKRHTPQQNQTISGSKFKKLCLLLTITVSRPWMCWWGLKSVCSNTSIVISCQPRGAGIEATETTCVINAKGNITRGPLRCGFGCKWGSSVLFPMRTSIILTSTPK